MFDLNFYFVWDQKQNALKISGGGEKMGDQEGVFGFECKWSRSGHSSVMIFMIPKTRESLNSFCFYFQPTNL